MLTHLTKCRRTTQILYQPITKLPEYVLKGNDNAENRAKVVDIDSKIDQAKLKDQNAQLKKKELMTLREFAQLVGEKAEDFPEIAPDRLLWVIQVYYPNGYDHHKVGLIKNAMFTQSYDAITGEYLGQDIKQVQIVISKNI
ncbi:hypothetical protein [Ammoniphilus sp. 3BR4]|uniref:hypothetical protein n=1 Tax=Ammoniphilus sp. 3BR4 TaxID=3158265 RepID=UPI0034653F89